MTADTLQARLAPYACNPAQTRGRLVAEQESPTRSCHQRDRDRIVHSGAFRKLKYKTQVFVYHEGDYYRTRLTHSLEVAQIARSISRALALNEDLAEAVALAHDLGHTPFGHAGEEALHACMAEHGGFSHNDQALRILTQLERRYADFDGLNLSWEALEGVVKHNGPLLPLRDGERLPVTIAGFERVWDLELHTNPGIEAQVAALADDIAYNNHDIDDGLRAGLFTVEEVAELPLVGPVVRQVRDRYPTLERPRLIHETIRRMIDAMVCDLLEETRRRLDEDRPADAAALRALPRPMVGFSSAMEEAQRPLRAFLRQRMYRHYRVNREMSKCKRVVTALFDLFMNEPNTLPTQWQPTQGQPTQGQPTQWQDDILARDAGDRDALARTVADYIAGMTDRYALAEYGRLFDMDAKT